MGHYGVPNRPGGRVPKLHDAAVCPDGHEPRILRKCDAKDTAAGDVQGSRLPERCEIPEPDRAASLLGKRVPFRHRERVAIRRKGKAADPGTLGSLKRMPLLA